MRRPAHGSPHSGWTHTLKTPYHNDGRASSKTSGASRTLKEGTPDSDCPIPLWPVTRRTRTAKTASSSTSTPGGPRLYLSGPLIFRVVMTSPARRPGRKPKLTPDVQERVVQAIRAGCTNEAAAGVAGIDETTLYRWLARGEERGAPALYREFRAAVLRARDELELRVVAGSVLKAALGGYTVKEVTRRRPDGTVETEKQIAPADGRVGLEMLARRFPTRWGRRSPIEVSGPGGGPIEVAHTSTIHELAERLRQLTGPSQDIVEGSVVEDDQS